MGYASFAWLINKQTKKDPKFAKIYGLGMLIAIAVIIILLILVFLSMLIFSK